MSLKMNIKIIVFAIMLPFVAFQANAQKNEDPTSKKSIINAELIRHCSASGYMP